MNKVKIFYCSCLYLITSPVACPDCFGTFKAHRIEELRSRFRRKPPGCWTRFQRVLTPPVLCSRYV